MKTKQAKKTALRILSNNWGQAMVVVLVLIIIHVIFTTAETNIYYMLKSNGLVSSQDFKLLSHNKYIILVSIVRYLLEFVLITPAYMGSVWWFLHCVRGQNNSVQTMFVCYSNFNIFVKSLALKLCISLIKLVAFLPVCICAFLQYRLINYALIHGFNNGIFILLSACCGLFSLCLLCFYIIFILRYALVDYIFVLNPDLNVLDIIKASTKKMKNNKALVVKLPLSFLCWIPSALLVFPLIFLLPYYAMSFTVMINSIIVDDFTSKRELLLGTEAASLS